MKCAGPAGTPATVTTATARPPRDAARRCRGAAIYARPARPAMRRVGRRPLADSTSALSTAVNAPNPQNIINVTLFGLPPADGEASAVMPGFASSARRPADRRSARLYARGISPASAGLGRCRRDGAQDAERRIQGRRPAGRRHRTSADQCGRGGLDHGYDTRRQRQDARDRRRSRDAACSMCCATISRSTRAKFGCGLGQCGSCTVMVDGEAVLSCVTPIMPLAGRKITTLEGLGTIDAPGPIQTAFIEMQAAQCGYCIPGMMMTRAGAAAEKSRRRATRDPRRARDQSLPLRHAYAHPGGDQAAPAS